MGFYSPATIVKDASRHGVKTKPVSVAHSEWNCTVLSDDTIRLGFRVVNGMRQEAISHLLAARAQEPFQSVDDLKRRVSLSKQDLRNLAELGALNSLGKHRRSAMWQVEEAMHDDLLGSALVSSAGCGVSPQQSLTASSRWRDAIASTRDECATQKGDSPLAPMTLPERVQADYETMNLTTGPHPMKLLRNKLPTVWRAIDLPGAQAGATIHIAGNVICRQRPGTAKGFVFISLEDETGVSNAIVEPDLFEKMRLLITEEPFLLIEGEVQNSEGVVLIKARKLEPLLHDNLVGSPSHDFH
jgi:error-prone DNA polymerase